jgi:hypothetical protein
MDFLHELGCFFHMSEFHWWGLCRDALSSSGLLDVVCDLSYFLGAIFGLYHLYVDELMFYSLPNQLSLRYSSYDEKNLCLYFDGLLLANHTNFHTRHCMILVIFV